MKKRVADIVFETLIEEGINTCFSVVGGGAMHLNNAMAINKDLKLFFNHHEQASAMAAEAYARYIGKPAIVCVTSGPGATNAITGVMGAWVDSIPMIVISGNVRYATSVEETGLSLRYRGLQEFDIINSVHNMTKYAKKIIDPKTIKEEVRRAINIAMSGRRGPVWLDIPQDVQSTFVEEKNLTIFQESEYENKGIDKEIELIIESIKEAERPCILIGTGIAAAHAHTAFLEFSKKVKIPIVGGAWFADALHNRHDMFYGLSGNVGPRTGNYIIQNSDCILVLGNSLSYRQTGYDIDDFASKARIIMVDADENEYLKIKEKIDTFVQIELNEFFKHMNMVKGLKMQASQRWLNYCEKLKAKFSAYEGAVNISMEDRVNKYYFFKCFNELSPQNLTIALGNSQVGLAMNQVGREYEEQRVISNYICGSMGYDLPAAIGAAVASRQQTICITGDGSVMMNLQELQTIIGYKLPIKIVVFENNGYGAIKQTCNNFFEGISCGCCPDTGVSFPDFSKIADSFGYDYNICKNNAEVKEKIEWLFANDKTTFLEVKQSYNDPVVPKLISKLDKDGKMSSPKLYDMFPFVSDEDMRWIMNP